MKNILFAFLIVLSFRLSSQNTCSSAFQLCANMTFPAATNNFTSDVGPYYGCLGVQPNCTWFYTQVVSPGNINICESAAADVDFICWGPFNNLSSVCGTNLNSSNVVDCSYSSSPTETLHIVNATVGQYYIFLCVNYSNQNMPVSIQQIGGNGTTCSFPQIINGRVYKDLDNNCLNDTGDQPLQNIPVKLYDNIGNLLVQTTSSANGTYGFSMPPGTYSLSIDTAGASYTPSCTYPGLDTLVTVSYLAIANINFNLDCPTGADVGVSSIVTTGTVFPALSHNLHVVAGNLNNLYNLNCTAGFAGTVQVSVSGPVTYIGPGVGALTPNSVSSNLYTYTISNFNAVNLLQDFDLIFNINSTAVAGNSVCVSVTVTPAINDINLSNNTLQYCYDVTNSFDPNYKETYPENVDPGYTDWFYYTIHFQNTGTAAAQNIKILDTLSNNLDLTTFKVINNSHPLVSTVTGNAIDFEFQNINLPSSSSSQTNSIGFVQYKIKPKPNLPGGTQIKNRAYIYFDFNAPIITNISVNNFLLATGINSNSLLSSTVYPNPTNGIINFKSIELSNSETQIEIYNVSGKLIFKELYKTSQATIDISKETNGLYFMKVYSGKEYATYKILKQ